MPTVGPAYCIVDQPVTHSPLAALPVHSKHTGEPFIAVQIGTKAMIIELLGSANVQRTKSANEQTTKHAVHEHKHMMIDHMDEMIMNEMASDTLQPKHVQTCSLCSLLH